MADVDGVVDKISQYKKYLDKYLAKSPDENKLLYVFKKLSRLAITLEHLQMTGIGKTVNGFRKHDGAIGDTSRTLVTKWKSLVASEVPSIKCETVSTTNYHRAGTSDESVRAPYIDAPILKAPYMDRKSLDPTNRNNSGKTISDGENSGGDSGLVNSSVNETKLKQEIPERHTSSHENNKYIKHETGSHTTHGKHNRHKHGKHDRHKKHGVGGECPKDVGMVKIKQEKLKNDKHDTKFRHSGESQDKPTGHTRNATVDLGLVKHENIDMGLVKDEQPDLEVHRHVSVKTEKEDSATVDHAQFRVDLGRVKLEENTLEISSPKKSVKSDNSKSQRSCDASRMEKKDKHHKRAKEKHGHISDKLSTEKINKHKTCVSTIDDGYVHKGHGGHRNSVNTTNRKSKVHDMSDVDDDDVGNDSSDRQREGVVEEERVKGSTCRTEVKHRRTRDSPDDARSVSIDNADDDDNDNGGMSFDDFLNYDATAVKLPKKNKTMNPSDANKKTASSEKRRRMEHESRSSSSHSKHKHDKSKHSNDKHKSKAKAGSASGGHSKDGKKREKRKAVEEFSVPEPKKQVKLTPDDILSTLPETNPNYRPLPQFRPDSPTRLGGGNFTSQLIGSKTHTRTQVYSGRRQVFLTAVPTLFEACIKVLIDNIEALDYVGGVPYDILQPVLEKCTPTQLYHLEDCNPAFLADTDVLWKHNCHQDFKSAKLDEFESWRELYLKCSDEREAKLKSLTARISASMVKKAEPVRKTRLAYVDTAAKPPREFRRAQQRHGTAGPMKGLDPLYKLSSHGGIQAPRAPTQHTDPTASQQRRATKTVAPMMAKSLKLMKRWRRN